MLNILHLTVTQENSNEKKEVNEEDAEELSGQLNHKLNHTKQKIKRNKKNKIPVPVGTGSPERPTIE